MPRYIDADDAIYELERAFPIDDYGKIIRCISRTPTADVVEVVRCKECKWSDTFSDITAEPHSPLKCLGIRYGGVNEDWFCEHGERIDDGRYVDNVNNRHSRKK